MLVFSAAFSAELAACSATVFAEFSLFFAFDADLVAKSAEAFASPALSSVFLTFSWVWVAAVCAVFALFAALVASWVALLAASSAACLLACVTTIALAVFSDLSRAEFAKPLALSAASLANLAFFAASSSDWAARSAEFFAATWSESAFVAELAASPALSIAFCAESRANFELFAALSAECWIAAVTSSTWSEFALAFCSDVFAESADRLACFLYSWITFSVVFILLISLANLVSIVVLIPLFIFCFCVSVAGIVLPSTIDTMVLVIASAAVVSAAILGAIGSISDNTTFKGNLENKRL